MKKVATLITGLMFSGVAFSSDWHTYFKNDEMRGTAQRFIKSESDNVVNFGFPYEGGSKMEIVLRSKKTALRTGQKADSLPLTEAILVIRKGVFNCNPFNDCHVSVKFDNSKIQKYSMSGAADGVVDVIFFNNSSSFIKNIKTHKKLILEADFYQSGKEQFKFDFTRLKTEKQ
ncbi:hypothetical protein XS16_004315 [Salmonella enterica subsp. enterica serovar Newport]|nr:hypothetical protein [Salmonella enterica subsp. enterica serovar Newport]EDT3087896.1 hypothetical protein [Salmonella enterica subsp. enterica serovar Newport]